MTRSIAEVSIGPRWRDLYEATGWTLGMPLLVWVVHGSIQIAVETFPPASGTQGTRFSAGQSFQIDGGHAGVYVQSFGGEALLSVQSSQHGIRAFPFSDPRVIDGHKAFTVQPFTELNSKRGTQYEAAFYSAALAAGASLDLVIVIGTGRILVKSVQTQFDGLSMTSQVFKGPIYTGGVALPIFNMNDEDAVPGTVALLGGATVSNPGTAVGSLTHSLGSDGLGNRALSSLASGAGVERVFSENATYLYRLQNTSAAPMRLASVVSWYQGPISVEIQ